MALRGLNELRNNDLCAFYVTQRDDETQQARRYTTLIFLVALAATAALVAAIFAIFVVDDTGRVLKIVTALGTILGATAVAFLKAEQQKHLDKAKGWIKAIQDDNCP